MRLPGATDTRLLLAGLVAFLALVVYLAVAFATMHGSIAAVNKVAPWTPYASKLVPVPWTRGRYTVRVIPSTRSQTGTYGAVVQTLVPNPTRGRRYLVGLWLRGAAPGRIGVEVNEFRTGVARYPVNTTVPATVGWHHYTFSLKVNGTWLGLAVVVSRPNQLPRTWFAVRGPTAAIRGR